MFKCLKYLYVCNSSCTASRGRAGRTITRRSAVSAVYKCMMEKVQHVDALYECV